MSLRRDLVVLFLPTALLLLAGAIGPASAGASDDPAPNAVYRVRDARTGRVSSWDRSGDNRDFISFAAGETKELLRLDGPGIITHVYMTPAAGPAFLRTAILRMYWDDEESPSVEVPFGDFFCAGESRPRLFASRWVVVNHGSGTVAYNAYFPMPFRKRARITLENCGKEEVPMFWYHIEHERLERDLPPDAAYFHAQWRRERPTLARREGPGAVPKDQTNRTIWEARNATGADNYVILEASGRGHLVGLYLTCRNLAGGWWGEGDDMIFIDGETWPPSYHGTGTEEIFGGGACPWEEYTGPYTGFIVIEEPRKPTWRGQNSMYRWFVHEPVRFRSSIRWTIEHGHANNFENEYSSVAYWYQIEPHAPFPKLPEDRLPTGGAAAPAPAAAPPIEGAIEAEELMEKATRKGGNATVVRIGGPWSKGAVALFLAEGAGSAMAFPVRVERSGRVRVGAWFARASDLGRYRLLVDGRPLGAEVDLFNGEGGDGPTHVVATGEVVFGELDLEAGEHRLELECLGKADGSGNFFLAVDAFALRPVEGR